MGKVITISREYGSGGRDIAEMIAKKLGIPCYDQQIIEKIAEESGYAQEFVNQRSESMPYSNWIGNALAMGSNAEVSEFLWSAQCKVLKKLASDGPCVIVGRCADKVLKDEFETISAFIHADYTIRCNRAVSSYGDDAETIKKKLAETDKRRKAYYELYTDASWGEAKNYDVCLDSGTLGLEKCVDAICLLYNE